MVSEADKIKNAHLQFAAERGFGKTYCPSEVARELFPEEWRSKMDLVREVADQLVTAGKLQVLQGNAVGRDLVSKLKGPIRLRRK